MLTVKEINEVSFGKAGFSGYKPEDVDNFIDEVAASFQQLESEHSAAIKQADEFAAQNEQLKAKNSELQEKLAILAEKIESYRAEEDGIKDALLSAQKLARDSVQEAKDKAEIILHDAQDNARQIMEGAKTEAAKAAKEYMAQADAKKAELEEIKRQVTAFRASLMEMYKKHLECINHIPSFRQKETEISAAEQPKPVEEPAQPDSDETEASGSHDDPEMAEEIPAAASETTEEYVQPEPEVQQPVRQEPRAQHSQEPSGRHKHEGKRGAEKGPTLHDRVNYAQEQLYAPASKEPVYDDDLSDVGIDLKTYSDIPETLRKEKSSHFSNLEFGDNVDLGNSKKRKR